MKAIDHAIYESMKHEDEYNKAFYSQAKLIVRFFATMMMVLTFVFIDPIAILYCKWLCNDTLKNRSCVYYANIISLLA